MNTKDHILQTSLLLFLQKSYRDVTMSEIVEKTGLSKGAFYHYFKSKEELFKEIVNMFFASGKFDYSLTSEKTLKEFYTIYATQMEISLQGLYGLLPSENKKNLNFFFLLFEAISRFPEFLQMELDIHKKDVEEWKKIISRARKNSEIKSSSTDEEIAKLFLYTNDGVFIRYVNNDNSSISFKDFLINVYDTIYENIRI